MGLVYSHNVNWWIGVTLALDAAPVPWTRRDREDILHPRPCIVHRARLWNQRSLHHDTESRQAQSHTSNGITLLPLRIPQPGNNHLQLCSIRHSFLRALATRSAQSPLLAVHRHRHHRRDRAVQHSVRGGAAPDSVDDAGVGASDLPGDADGHARGGHRAVTAAGPAHADTRRRRHLPGSWLLRRPARLSALSRPPHAGWSSGAGDEACHVHCGWAGWVHCACADWDGEGGTRGIWLFHCLPSCSASPADHGDLGRRMDLVSGLLVFCYQLRCRTC